MSIISKETFDKFTEEEKAHLFEVYDSTNVENHFNQGIRSAFKLIFGKENLQSKPEIKIWADVEKDNINWSNIDIDRLNTLDAITPKMRNKLIATYKIAKLIELGYGGMVTEEEWKDHNIRKFYIINNPHKSEPSMGCTYYASVIYFIAFHTQEQCEEFMSYPENVKLIKQYFQI